MRNKSIQTYKKIDNFLCILQLAIACTVKSFHTGFYCAGKDKCNLKRSYLLDLFVSHYFLSNSDDS